MERVRLAAAALSTVFKALYIHTYRGATCSLGVTLRWSEARLQHSDMRTLSRPHPSPAQPSPPHPPPPPLSRPAHTCPFRHVRRRWAQQRFSRQWGLLSQRVPLPVCILLYIILRCRSTIKQTGVEGFALLSAGEDARQRAQPHLLFLLLTLRLLQIF